MSYKYKYEGKDKNGKKKFSKTYKPQKWVGDYENNCVRDYDNYIKESLKNGTLTQADVNDISYFEGSYENACKFFRISGESCQVYDRDSGMKVIKENEDSHEIKIQRFKKLVEKHQTQPRYLKKSSAELFIVLTSKMNEQYYYIAPESKEDIAMEVLFSMYSDYIKGIDDFLINAENKKEAVIEYEEKLKEALGDLYDEKDEAMAKRNIEMSEIPRSLKRRIYNLNRFLSKHPGLRK